MFFFFLSIPSYVNGCRNIFIVEIFLENNLKLPMLFKGVFRRKSPNWSLTI